MAANTPTTEPTALIAGDTAKWLKTLTDYPASEGWTLSYSLVSAANRINFSASASGDLYLVAVPAATTSVWVSGSYEWRAQVSKSGEVFTVATGSILVQPSFGSAVDNRSHARKALTNIEAYLENAGNLSAASYEIAGRKLQRINLPELLAMRDKYKGEVAREEAAANVGRGLPDRRRIMVRFGA
jgi:hypothetical protein